MMRETNGAVAVVINRDRQHVALAVRGNPADRAAPETSCLSPSLRFLPAASGQGRVPGIQGRGNNARLRRQPKVVQQKRCNQAGKAAATLRAYGLCTEWLRSGTHNDGKYASVREAVFLLKCYQCSECGGVLRPGLSFRPAAAGLKCLRARSSACAQPGRPCAACAPKDERCGGRCCL